MVTQGEGGPSSSASLGTSGSQAGDFWFTQPTAGILSFYGVTDKVDASTDLATANFATKFPMISYVRYTGETGFGEGSGGGGSVELVSADSNVNNMIAGTAQTMTTTSFEFDGDVNITGKLSITKGTNNTIIGKNAGTNITTGADNVMIGHYAGQSANGSNNTFIGKQAGYNNTSSQNTFVGKESGYNSTSGYDNTGVGYESLY